MNALEVAANIKCRQDAEEVASFGFDQPVRFWECLLRICEEHLPPKPAQPDRYPPLTDTEAMRFEAMPMPYGKHAGEAVGEVPCDYLLFLTEGDEFSQRLKRYVKSKRFSERQEP